MIAKAAQARRVADTTRLPAPAKAGLEALDAASAETRAAAEAARQARNLEQDRRAATAAERSVQAADETANIARTAEEGLVSNAAKIAKTENAANTAAKAARAGMVTQRLTQGLGGGEAAAGVKVSPYDIEDMRKADEMPTDKEIIKTAKDVLPAKERKGMTDEDLLVFGLGLMSGTSSNAFENIGKAGLGAIMNKKEREKAEQDLEYKDILKQYYGSMGKKAESEAAYIASGEKGRMADRQKAAAAIQDAMEAWQKSLGGATATPQEETAQRNKLTQYYFNLFGLDLPTTMATTTGGGLPQGVKVTPYG
jgi:hypothetical protein